MTGRSLVSQSTLYYTKNFSRGFTINCKRASVVDMTQSSVYFSRLHARVGNSNVRATLVMCTEMPREDERGFRTAASPWQGLLFPSAASKFVQQQFRNA